MLLAAAGERIMGRILENGCGVGLFSEKLASLGGQVFALEYVAERAGEAKERVRDVVRAACEKLPYPNDFFDLILSHEVIEHVENDAESIREMVRVLRTNGRLVLFCPNRGYPVETHGVYWRGRYYFGNIPLVNYLPRPLRDVLAPHVRVYSTCELKQLFGSLPIRVVERTIIFGGYDNIIARFPRVGRALRGCLHRLERTPLRFLGLSHFWVVEKL